jgi:hypothetical protein
MDVGVYNTKMNSSFLDHHYFKPLVYSPINEKEDFQANTTKNILVKNRHTISLILNIIIVLLIIYLLMILTGADKKCLKKMK